MSERASRIAKPGIIGAGLFLLALATRLIYLLQSMSGPTFDAPIVDAHTYHRLASAFAGGGGLTDEYFWQPFFYPLFLSVVYSLNGGSILLTKLLQVLLGGVTCVLTYRLARSIFDERVGLVAGAIVALYGPLVFFDAELLATGWAAFWSVALLLLFLRAERLPGTATLLLLGAAGALSVVTRPTFLPFFAAACLWLGFAIRGRAGGAKAAAARLLFVLAGFLLLALPVALLSRAHTGRLSILPASGGINLYVGNNPDVFHTVSLRPGTEWDELTRLPRKHGVVNKQDTSRFFRNEVGRYLRDDPLGFAKGILLKTVQFLGSRELPRNVDLYVHREWSGLLSGLVWKAGGFGVPFGLLLPLTGLGWILCRRRIPLPLQLYLLLYPAAVVLVFVTSRYRTPVVPVMAVVAAAGIFAAVAHVRERRWQPLAAGAALAGVLALLSFLPGPFPQEATDYKAELLYYGGVQAMEANELDRAAELVGEALSRQPKLGDAHNTMGLIHARRGRLAQAQQSFETAVEVNPRSVTARDNLARTLAARGDVPGAVRELRLALALRPDDAGLNLRLGKALGALGQLDDAEHRLRRSLEIAPGNPEAVKELQRIRERR